MKDPFVDLIKYICENAASLTKENLWPSLIFQIISHEYSNKQNYSKLQAAITISYKQICVLIRPNQIPSTNPNHPSRKRKFSQCNYN